MSDSPVEIEYNQHLQPLEDLLTGFQRAGSFFTSGEMECPMPRIELDDAGPLSFPVPDEQVARLIEAAERAPYGRGEETVLDTSVRKVWQIAPSAVEISGKSWKATFDSIFHDVLHGLGCEAGDADVELYKLLIYDEGGFFRPHRDTEKSDGMFGTLVVCLPCPHQGGELVVRHREYEEAIDLSCNEVSELRYAAFYADCEHEVLPIRSGNRVCLVYNLLHRSRGAGKAARKIEAPDNGPAAKQAAGLLEHEFSDSGAAKLVWLLEHQYSPAGLTFAGLKGADAARVAVLLKAAAPANCVAHLAIVHIEESGIAEPSYDGGHYGRSRYGGFGWNEEEEDEGEDEEFEIIEASNWNHYLSDWRDSTDRVVDFGRIPLVAGELFPAGSLDGEKPDQQRLLEASGNEGCSYERSYHRAVLVIWPRDRHGEVLLQAGAASAIPYLRDLIAAGEIKTAKKLAGRIISDWPQQDQYSWPERRYEKEGDRAKLLEQLNALEDAKIWERFVTKIVVPRFDGAESALIADGIHLLPPARASAALSQLFAQSTRWRSQSSIRLLKLMADQHAANSRRGWAKVLEAAVAAIIDQLPVVGRPKKGGEHHDWGWHEDDGREKADGGSVMLFLEVLARLGFDGLRATATNTIIGSPDAYDPADLVAPALIKADQAVATEGEPDQERQLLCRHCVQFLLNRSSSPPPPPKDWRQSVTFNCKCEDCHELQLFARDAREQVHRFRIRKDRRMHLHRQIDHHDLDMTHATERKGSPQTLVCTKTRRTFERQCERYKKDIQLLTQLTKLPGAKEQPDLTKSAKQAIARKKDLRM